MKSRTYRLTVSAIMLAFATVLALVCANLPFLNLPFGGGFTIASMLPIVIVSYMFGMRWGFLTSFVYALIQLMLGAFTGGGYVLSLFTVGSEDFMGVGAGIAICFLDYLVAYTVLALGGIFRNRLSQTPALVLGTLVALGARYLVHIVSGAIFFGVWAEWFFGQDGFYAIGSVILNHFSGVGLSVIYSVFYNGLYMLPEMLITAVAAVPVSRIPQIKAA